MQFVIVQAKLDFQRWKYLPFPSDRRVTGATGEKDHGRARTEGTTCLRVRPATSTDPANDCYELKVTLGQSHPSLDSPVYP
jgi:hypothetical protein